MKTETLNILNVFKRIPTLFTERLILRRIERRDIDDIFDYASNPETSKYLLWYPHNTKFDTKVYFNAVDKRYKLGKFYDWAVVDKTSGKMIGTCGFTSITPEDEKAEIGYVINPSYKGRGIATEAVKRVLRFGFDELLLERIEARYIIGNDASLRVMQKCGMRFEGTQRHGVKCKGRFADVGICAITSGDFITKRQF